MIGITDLIAGIFKPAVDLVDELHTSDEEKMLARAKIETIQNQAFFKIQEYETNLISAQRDIITAEATGQSWMQRNWRPLLMMVIVCIVANNFLLYPYLSLFTAKVTVLTLPAELYTLMTVGVGGYIGGRSLEKGIEKWKSK